MYWSVLNKPKHLHLQVRLTKENRFEQMQNSRQAFHQIGYEFEVNHDH